jgi:hypothetical protein
MSYTYVISSGTGAYKKATGQGSATLTVTPSTKAAKPGTFTLVITSS